MSYQQEKFKEIADKIREKTGTTTLIVPNDFASKIDDVYEAGRAAGGGGETLPDADVMEFPLSDGSIGRVSTDSQYYDEIAKAISEYGGLISETITPLQMTESIRISQENAYISGKTSGLIEALEQEAVISVENSYVIKDGANRMINSLEISNPHGEFTAIIEFTDETKTNSQSITIDLYGGAADYLIYENGQVIKGNNVDYIEEDITNTVEGQAIMALYTYEGVTNITCNVVCKIGYVKSVLKEQYNTGRQAQYDEFWKEATDNNTRTNYRYAFCGAAWNDDTFNPPYTLKPINAERMFAQYCGITKLTKSQVDFSRATSMVCALGYYNKLEEIEEVNITATSTLANYIQLFRYATSLVTIGKLILHENGSEFDDTIFHDTRSLTNINEIVGKIDGTNVSFSYCKNLTETSVINIFNALKDYSGTETKPSIQMHTTVKTWLKEKPEIEGIATGKGWNIT